MAYIKHTVWRCIFSGNKRHIFLENAQFKEQCTRIPMCYPMTEYKLQINFLQSKLAEAEKIALLRPRTASGCRSTSLNVSFSNAILVKAFCNANKLRWILNGVAFIVLAFIHLTLILLHPLLILSVYRVSWQCFFFKCVLTVAST